MQKLIRNKRFLKYFLTILLMMGCGVAYLLQRGFPVSSDSNMVLENTTISSVSTQSATQDSNVMETQTEASASTQEELLYIYVCGNVNVPGVYRCRQGSRVYELIEMAGGYTAEADETYLNLVDMVSDGQKLYVPAKGEIVTATAILDSSVVESTLININKATKEQLMTLPGIGEAKATDIIAYRTTNQSFETTEDIMNVSGIKEAAYQKIKDLICVN